MGKRLTEAEIAERLAHPERLTSRQLYYLRHIDKERAKCHAAYQAHAESRREYARKYAAAHKDEIAAYQKARRAVNRMDPEWVARETERNHEYNVRCADKRRAYAKAYVKKHKGRRAKYLRFYRDRIRHYCRIDPEYYAMFRARQRVICARYWRKHHVNVRAYHPRINMRIPDELRRENVLDVRSVFLWNNLPAESLRANRAYHQMQMRERCGEK